MKYYEIAVATTTEGSELVADVMNEIASDGVVINDRNDLKISQWDYADEGLFDSYDATVRVSAYVRPELLSTSLAFLRSGLSRLQNCGSLEVCVREVDDKDWLDVWKKFYNPVPIGDVIICPAWLSDNNPKNVLIDTGLAFGTGQHETTSMCVELLQRFELTSKTVLDIGCGSGILGLTAIKLGAAKSTFVDNDSQATETTLANAKLNGFEKACEIISGNLADSVVGTFDVVTANLTVPILTLLYPDIDKCVHDGSIIILSGILSELADQIINSYGSKFEIIERLDKGCWTAFMLKVNKK